MTHDPMQIKLFLSHSEIMYLFGLLDEKFVQINKAINSSDYPFPFELLEEFQVISKLFGKFELIIEL